MCRSLGFHLIEEKGVDADSRESADRNPQRETELDPDDEDRQSSGNRRRPEFRVGPHAPGAQPERLRHDGKAKEQQGKQRVVEPAGEGRQADTGYDDDNERCEAAQGRKDCAAQPPFQQAVGVLNVLGQGAIFLFEE